MSSHHAYRRTVIDALGEQDAAETYRSLTGIMNVEGDPGDQAVREYVRNNTLVRRINVFDPDEVLFHRSVTLAGSPGNHLKFVLPSV